MDSTLLMQEAIKARAKAYIPYSRFGVGAALLDQDGHIHLAVMWKMLLLAQPTVRNGQHYSVRLRMDMLLVLLKQLP